MKRLLKVIGTGAVLLATAAAAHAATGCCGDIACCLEMLAACCF
jgi:hypothetical protein